jgi:hypothetical protein
LIGVNLDDALLDNDQVLRLITLPDQQLLCLIVMLLHLIYDIVLRHGIQVLEPGNLLHFILDEELQVVFVEQAWMLEVAVDVWEVQVEFLQVGCRECSQGRVGSRKD